MRMARRMKSIVHEREKKLEAINEEVDELFARPAVGGPNNPFNMKPTSLAAVVAQATKRAKFMNKTWPN